jgi:hypothetical protein
MGYTGVMRITLTDVLLAVILGLLIFVAASDSVAF